MILHDLLDDITDTVFSKASLLLLPLTIVFIIHVFCPSLFTHSFDVTKRNLIIYDIFFIK